MFCRVSWCSLLLCLALVVSGCGDDGAAESQTTETGGAAADVAIGGGVGDAPGPAAEVAEADPVDEGNGDPPDDAPRTYLGGWQVGDCANEPIEGTGTKVGDIAYDFQQPDQFGQMLRLHDFCDRFILLVGSAYW